MSLPEALAHLAAHGIAVTPDRIDGVWRYVMDGAATTEGEIVARAVALGMLATKGGRYESDDTGRR